MSTLSADDKKTMLTAFAGLVTATIATDDDGVHAILAGIIEDQRAASPDAGAFQARMAKQVEAGARYAQSVIMALAGRLGMTSEELQRTLAIEAARVDIADE